MNNNINNCECPDQGGGRGRPPRGAPQRPAAPQGPRRPRGLVPARPPRGGPPGGQPPRALNETYVIPGRAPPPGQPQYPGPRRGLVPARAARPPRPAPPPAPPRNMEVASPEGPFRPMAQSSPVRRAAPREPQYNRPQSPPGSPPRSPPGSPRTPPGPPPRPWTAPGPSARSPSTPGSSARSPSSQGSSPGMFTPSPQRERPMPAMADQSVLGEIEDLESLGVLDHTNDCTGFNQSSNREINLANSVSAVSVDDFEAANRPDDSCLCDESQPELASGYGGDNSFDQSGPIDLQGDYGENPSCICDESQPELAADYESFEGGGEQACFCPDDNASAGKKQEETEDVSQIMASASQVSVYNPERLNTTMSPRNDNFGIRRRLMVSSFTQDMDQLDQVEEDLFNRTIEEFHQHRRDNFTEKLAARGSPK